MTACRQLLHPVAGTLSVVSSESVLGRRVVGVRKLAEWMGLVEDGRYSDPKDELSEEYSVDEYVEPEPCSGP